MKNIVTLQKQYFSHGSRLFLPCCRLIHIGLVLLLVAMATAHGAQHEDFSYNKTNGEIIITGYTGNNVHVEIPDEIVESPVVAIADFAFAHNTSLASVVIPGSVTHSSLWENGTYLTSFWNRIRRYFMPVDGCGYVSMWVCGKSEKNMWYATFLHSHTHVLTHSHTWRADKLWL